MVFLDMAPEIKKKKGRRGATSCLDCKRDSECIPLLLSRLRIQQSPHGLLEFAYKEARSY